MTNVSVQAGIFIVYETPSPVKFEDEGISLGPETPCLDTHIYPDIFTKYPEFRTRSAAYQSLTALANYAVLRSGRFDAEYVIGTTHRKLAEIAINEFGFSGAKDLPAGVIPTDREHVIREVYNGEPALIWLHTVDLIACYADGHPTDFIRQAAMKELATH